MAATEEAPRAVGAETISEQGGESPAWLISSAPSAASCCMAAPMRPDASRILKRSGFRSRARRPSPTPYLGSAPGDRARVPLPGEELIPLDPSFNRCVDGYRLRCVVRPG